jgi:type II secretion system protein G
MRNDKGFTLLEIIVVVFILSLLAAIVAPRIIGRTDDARIAEAKIQIKNFETALKLFKLDGYYPSTEQTVALLERNCRSIPRGGVEDISRKKDSADLGKYISIHISRRYGTLIS